MAKRRQLDRETVVAKAGDLADAAGSVHAVTLTTLAAALDVRVPSLYNHVAGLEDLHGALALYATEELLRRLRTATAGQSGFAALMQIAFAYRRFALDHPGTYPLTLAAPRPDENERAALAQELVQMLLLVFASCGIEGEDAIHAIRGLRALLHGFVSLEGAEGFKMPVALDESFRQLLTTYLTGLASGRNVRLPTAAARMAR